MVRRRHAEKVFDRSRFLSKTIGVKTGIASHRSYKPVKSTGLGSNSYPFRNPVREPINALLKSAPPYGAVGGNVVKTPSCEKTVILRGPEAIPIRSLKQGVDVRGISGLAFKPCSLLFPNRCQRFAGGASINFPPRRQIVDARHARRARGSCRRCACSRG